MKVVLASLWQELQHANMELGEYLAVNVMLSLKELDGPTSTSVGHVLRLVASFLNSLSERRRKEAVSKSWGTIEV